MLNKQIKKYRNLRELTIKELSKITGLSVRSIELLEDGSMNNPTLKTLQILSEGLKVDIEELIK